jgi:hypothetical protein
LNCTDSSRFNYSHFDIFVWLSYLLFCLKLSDFVNILSFFYSSCFLASLLQFAFWIDFHLFSLLGSFAFALIPKCSSEESVFESLIYINLIEVDLLIFFCSTGFWDYYLSFFMTNFTNFLVNFSKHDL